LLVPKIAWLIFFSAVPANMLASLIIDCITIQPAQMKRL
jgi:hypothetical protein